MTARQRTTLVAYDGSATAKAAVGYAARQLAPDGRLVVAHVVAPPAHYLDEIVIGSRGLGAARAALGSVSLALLHEADRPVVVLTERAAERWAGGAAAHSAR